MNRNGSGSGRVRGALAIGAALLVALGAAGCGSSDDDDKQAAAPAATTSATAKSDGKLPEMTKATLVLDYIPNALHTGIYRSIAAGYYEQENIDLRVIQPTSSADTLRLIDAGKADFGLADGYDVANQIDRKAVQELRAVSNVRRSAETAPRPGRIRLRDRCPARTRIATRYP